MPGLVEVSFRSDSVGDCGRSLDAREAVSHPVELAARPPPARSQTAGSSSQASLDPSVLDESVPGRADHSASQVPIQIR